MLITRRLEFDAGHRIQDHRSQCRHLHGHRYAIEITLSGTVIRRQGAPEDGMVMDFADVRAIAGRVLVDKWDHAFLVHRGDATLLEFLNSIPGHKTVVLEHTTTAENLAATAFDMLDRAYHDVYGNQLRLQKLRLYETPNCWVDVDRDPQE